MVSPNPMADRLLEDARKRGAGADSATLGIAALILGLLALAVAGMVPGAGWALGVLAIGAGAVGLPRPAAANLSKVGLGLGLLAIAVGTFFFLRFIGQL